MNERPDYQHEESGGSRDVGEAKGGPLFEKVSSTGRPPELKKFLTTHQDVYRKVLMFIEQGCFDYVAAESMGVTGRTWNNWMLRGEQDYHDGDTESLYGRFFLDVTAAKARARLMAEIQVRREDPKFYLRCGPGKTKPGRPGWTETIAMSTDEDLPLHDKEERDEPSVSDLAAALVLVEQLGFATPTREHGKMLEHYSKEMNKTVDEAKPTNGSGKASPPPSSPENTEEAPALEDMGDIDQQEEILDIMEHEEEKERGHHPDKGKPWKSVNYNDLPDEFK